MREFLPYWKGKSIFEKWDKMLPEDARIRYHLTHEAGAYSASSIHPGHTMPDYGKVLDIGLKGIEKQVDEKLGRLNLAEIEDFKKYHFYRAVKIALEAAIYFAKRYATLAKSLAEKETNRQRKAELKGIAEACEWVPANPARSFYEALQSVWLTYIPFMIEGWSFGMGFGRPDQYLYRFYKKDLAEGKMTAEKARELIGLILIKMNRSVIPQREIVVRTFGGALYFMEKRTVLGERSPIPIVLLRKNIREARG